MAGLLSLMAGYISAFTQTYNVQSRTSGFVNGYTNIRHLKHDNYAFYGNDSWRLNRRLTLTLGVRWDYESDMLNNDYVTPDSIRAATAPFVDGNRYFTDGSNRPPFYAAWQPRVGLSYDLTGAGHHVVFGGYGRYYDRIFYNAGLDEKFRLQWACARSGSRPTARRATARRRSSGSRHT